MTSIGLVIATAVAVSCDGTRAGHGVTRGRGPGRRALPHRRRRRRRAGEEAAAPRPDRAARREPHQRRHRAGAVRRDRLASRSAATQVGPLALTGRFVYSYLGGIAAGLLVGGLVTLLRRRIDAPLEEGALSLLTPFAAFLLAQSV